VFIVDSFRPRGVASTEQQQGALDPMANVADTLNALVLLANDPRIDKSRIAEMGFSRGGNVAIDTYFDLFRHAVIPGDLKFAANIPVYPSCAIRYRADATNTNHGPMLVLMGGKDDAGLASLCASYIDELNHTNNLNIQQKIYPNGWHGFDGYSRFQLARGAESARNCNMEVQLSAVAGNNIDAVDKTNGRKINTLQDWQQTYRSCRTFEGYHLSGDTSIRAEAEKDAVAFLKNTFGK
jgi:dienelactone hydrolase